MSCAKATRLSNLEHLIIHALDRVAQYESPVLQARALSLIPLDQILGNCSSSCKVHPLKPGVDRRKSPNGPDVCELCFLQELATWFKEDFFSWVNSPKCESCGGESQFKERYTTSWPISSKLQYTPMKTPYQVDVEDHACKTCGFITKFPRHSDASILLETRKGRCYEWAQVFTLMCRAVGYRARIIVDVTDHEWTEVFSHSHSRWVHVDSCEAAVDRPLLYEKGWGKKLSYVIAVGIDDVQDVAWRYSGDHKALLSRRNANSDQILLRAVIRRRNDLLQNVPAPIRKQMLVDVVRELFELMVEPTTESEYSGRTSGDKEWILSRSEDGGNLSDDQKMAIKLNKYKSGPGPSEIKILYSSALDKYHIRSPDVVESHDSWQKLTCTAENMFRKVEKDWNMAYLARKHASLPGIVEWHFDAGQFQIDRFSFEIGAFVKENCDVTCEVHSNNRGFAAKYKNVGVCSFKLLEPCRSVTFRVTLTSPPGSPDIAWQFTQLFREKITPNNDFSFGFTFDLI